MIFTLGVNAVAQGLMIVHTGGFAPQDSASAGMRFIATGRIIPGIPNAVLVWAVVGAAAVFALSRTTFGRSVYAIGNRERAAYLSGIPTRRVVMMAFAIAGALSGFGGVLLAGYASKAEQAMGDAYLLPAIAAVVLGGTNILGGRGQLSRHRRRRDPDHAAAVHPIRHADAGGGAPDDLRRGHHRDAAPLRAGEAVALGRFRVRLNQDGAPSPCRSMILSENRFPLFGIML